MERFSLNLFLGIIIIFCLFYLLDVNCSQLLIFVKHLGRLWTLNNGEHTVCTPLIGYETAVEEGTMFSLRPHSGKLIGTKSQVRISELERLMYQFKKCLTTSVLNSEQLCCNSLGSKHMQGVACRT